MIRNRYTFSRPLTESEATYSPADDRLSQGFLRHRPSGGWMRGASG